MTTFLFFVLSSIGLTNILVHGKIVEVVGLRKLINDKGPAWLKDMLQCYECTGFWAGLICGLAFFDWPWFLAYGLAGSAINKFYYDVTNLIYSKTEFEVGVPDEPK